MFIDFWPIIQQYMPERDERVDFTARLLSLFVHDDMDPWDVEDIHPDIRAALQLADIGVSEPERYEDCQPTDDIAAPSETGRNVEEYRAPDQELIVFSLAPFLASTKRRAAHNRYRLIALVLVHFLQDHGLTTRTVLPPVDTLTDNFVLRAGDLTEEGFRFLRQAEPKWLRSVDSGTSPTDTTVLASELKKLRSQ
jgi:hypothetical protein